MTYTQIDPAALGSEGGNFWDHARREYLSGVKATTICQRYGISLSSFRLHARVGKWRRLDQPHCDVAPEAGEYHPDDQVSFAQLADEAFLNIRRALGAGRASEASTWMRVYDRLADRARGEVMADLPDAPPPEAESNRPPLLLTIAVEDEVNVSNTLAHDPVYDAAQLDSLGSVFSESNPALSPQIRPDPGTPAPPASSPDRAPGSDAGTDRSGR